VYLAVEQDVVLGIQKNGGRVVGHAGWIDDRCDGGSLQVIQRCLLVAERRFGKDEDLVLMNDNSVA
jgi:hypothetical protein